MPTPTGSYYAYNPSKAAASIFAVIYIITTIISFFQTFRLKSWVWLLMILASIMETVGYIARIVSIKNVDKKGPYTISFALIILAPVVIAAAIYILFGRIVIYVTPCNKRTTRFLLVPPRFLTLIFVLCDLLAFVMQGIGAIRVSTGTDESTINSGKTLAIAGLIVQLAAFGLFSIISIRFSIKSRNFDQPAQNTAHPTGHRVAESQTTKLNPNWKGLLIGLNTVCGLILIRSIYRLVEFTTGKNGYVSTHEWTFYVFDAVPIYPIFLLFITMPPGNYVPYLSWRVPKEIIPIGYQLEPQRVPQRDSNRPSHHNSHSHGRLHRHSHSRGHSRRPSHSHSQRRGAA